MRVLVVGAGLVGFAIAYFLSGFADGIGVVDISSDRLESVRKFVGRDIETIRADIRNKIRIVDDYDVVSVALPGDISFSVVSKILDRGISVVDSSFMAEDPFILDGLTRERGVFYIPDAGFAPGLSNIFVGYFMDELGLLDSVEIFVGGLPVEPVGPLYHLVNWSITDFLEEYTRPARIVSEGQIRQVDPLDYFERIELYGEAFEAFYTDGLRTLLRTVRARSMFEKTIRYPGHLEKMVLLRDLGLFSGEIEVNGIRVSSRKVLLSLLRRTIYDPDMRDRAILYVRVTGGKGESREVFLEERYDDELGLSAMAKLTGFTNASIIKHLEDKLNGVIPPEVLPKSIKEAVIEDLIGETELEFTRTYRVHIKHGKLIPSEK